ncbi:MAG: SH3 domain-containing protein [Chloroflexi bacterium]|nr:SH3 domain-containing protein [Chloroflexota bacterium]
MRVFSLLIVGLCGLLLMLTPAAGQGQEQPLVVFVEERELQMASVTDSGIDGLTRLAQTFTDLGARTRFVRLRDPLPDETQVIVLVRPRRRLPEAFLARIWKQVEQGANLLLALDPPGHVGTNTETVGSGLDTLMTLDYGIGLQDGFVATTSFTTLTAQDLVTSFLRVSPEINNHPVIEPLITYDVPLQVWGARHLRVEPFGPDTTAFPLLFAEPVFAENDNIFRNQNPLPLELNIGSDDQGRLIIGALGENERTGTRLALLADGEMVQNAYGFGRIPASVTPEHPGNVVFAQRLAAWLLELPQSAWPELLPRFTWLRLDGLDDDWNPALQPTLNPASDASILALSLQQVRAFRNEDFLYLLIDTATSPNPNVQVVFGFDSRGAGAADTIVVANRDRIYIQPEAGAQISIPDAAFVIADSIELRLPLRVTGISSRIPSLCLNSARELAFPTPPDCIESVAVTSIGENDPAAIRFESDLLVTVISTSRINLRNGPGTNFGVITTIPNGRVFAAVGRDAAGEWIQVQNARYQGWIASFLLAPNGDLQSLPVATE